MRAILQHKLTKAIVMFRQDIPSTVVTLDSHVSHRIDGGPAETRVVADDAMRGLVGLTVMSITNPPGLAILGLAEGQSVTLQRDAAETKPSLYQPEAAEKGRMTAQIVHDFGTRRIERMTIPASPDPNPHGPSAA